jgi:hypothetical protein
MIFLADLIDRYCRDLEQHHRHDLLPGHYRALQAMRRCRNQHSRVMVLDCNESASIRPLSPIPAATAAAPTASIIKASNGWNVRRPNYCQLTISWLLSRYLHC